MVAYSNPVKPYRSGFGINQSRIFRLFETHLVIDVNRVSTVLDISYSDARIALIRLHRAGMVSRYMVTKKDKRGYRRHMFEFYLKPWQRAWLEGGYLK